MARTCRFDSGCTDDVVGAGLSDMKAIPIVLLNGGRIVVGARMSDMNAISSCLLNGDQVVVDARGSDINNKNLLIDDRIKTTRNQSVGACGSDMNVTPTVLFSGDRLVVGACVSDMNAPLLVRTKICSSMIGLRRKLTNRSTPLRQI